MEIPGIAEPLQMIARKQTMRRGAKYLFAVSEAGKIYRHIAAQEGVRAASSRKFRWTKPTRRRRRSELLLILAAIADEGIPIQTIAPKFTGRFNKGVDYVGNVEQFETRVRRGSGGDRAIAVQRYGLPANLKLSVHSGSDKFSIYAPIRALPARSSTRACM